MPKNEHEQLAQVQEQYRRLSNSHPHRALSRVKLTGSLFDARLLALASQSLYLIGAKLLAKAGRQPVTRQTAALDQASLIADLSSGLSLAAWAILYHHTTACHAEIEIALNSEAMRQRHQLSYQWACLALAFVSGREFADLLRDSNRTNRNQAQQLGAITPRILAAGEAAFWAAKELRWYMHKLPFMSLLTAIKADKADQAARKEHGLTPSVLPSKQGATRQLPSESSAKPNRASKRQTVWPRRRTDCCDTNEW